MADDLPVVTVESKADADQITIPAPDVEPVAAPALIRLRPADRPRVRSVAPADLPRQ